MELLKIKRKKSASLEKRKALSGYVFVLPFIVGFLLIYLPILIDSIGFSFFQQGEIVNTGTHVYYKYNFAAFKGYVEAFGENDFVLSLGEGLQQLVLEVPAIIIFALFIAVVLNQKMLGRAAFRAIFFVPVIISTGLIDSINGASGSVVDNLGSGIDDGSSASGLFDITQMTELFREFGAGVGEIVGYVVELVNKISDIISYSGVQMLIFLAGLQSISESIYEACRIDGATGWETFWKVTFPMISPMILVNSVYTVIDSFTRDSNVTMTYIEGFNDNYNGLVQQSMYWIYFGAVILIIAAVVGVISSFIFYQRKD